MRNYDPLVFNRVFVVYNKDSGLGEQDFKDVFGHIGTIVDVHLMKDKRTGKEKGIAYIRFEKSSEACRACEEMQGQMIPGNPRPIRVHIAQDKKDSLEIDVDEDTMLHRLFIKHPKEEDEPELKEYFSQWGEVTWMYVLKDKKTGGKRGAAFVKYKLQSQAAKAKEECDEKYGARWADVRVMDPMKAGMKRQMEQGFDMGGGMGMGGPMGGGGMGGMDMMSQMMGGGAMGGGASAIEALVPNCLTQHQIYRLFDIVPGLQSCNVNPMSGIATVVYNNPTSANHAKIKIDSFDIFGTPIAVRLPKGGAQSSSADTTAQLQNALQTLKTAGAGNMQALVKSLQQVTEAIGGGGGGSSAMDFTDDDISNWVNKTLPDKKPMASADSTVACKVFINSMPGPQLPPDELIENVCCRFGNLISWRWLPKKRFGFADYADKESAQQAVEALTGIVVMDNELKVEIGASTQPQEGPSSKRSRFS